MSEPRVADSEQEVLDAEDACFFPIFRNGEAVAYVMSAQMWDDEIESCPCPYRTEVQR